MIIAQRRSFFSASYGSKTETAGTGSLFELRIAYGPGYRVYCKEKGSEIVIILGGGTKSGQQQDIEKAKELVAEQEK